ncbi:eukaryotic peptide chain release factor GTP-binding subunit ERF3A-like [Acanthaster planci]|uniref:Eukaryotic peptide chain release factor GTP-binding subunit ERF3A-like n=1 Tax=Acanthaster planci TaxID=133434 RepID=A0A8B7ZEC6_ACAPL|nr:eukaryotic peptide chain release factor GTP-binding subunit ERF3A-like [Acanthaster planci]
MDPDPSEGAALDSWEEQADPGPGNHGDTVDIGSQFSALNVNAKPFVPNVNAPAFVPNFGNYTPKTEPCSTNDKDEPSGQASPAQDSGIAEAEDEATPQQPVPDAKEPAPPDLDGREENEEEEINSSPSSEEESGARAAATTVADTATKSSMATSSKKTKKTQDTEIKERKVQMEHVNVIFIGHVDAGKSTIGGHIMYLTGQVDKRTLEKYEREAKEKNRESWYLSWALDTNLEEREKGKTVEVGRANFETGKKHFTILDAPGHRSFVPNMICGAAQADLAVLVISARKGEFETGFERGGQTREHAMLAKTAGVKHLVVLINKMDDPTVEWSEERYEECKTKLIPFLKKASFNPKKDIFFIPVSGITGANLKDPAREVCPWYNGPAFIPYIDSLPSLGRKQDGPLRMPITDRFKDMGTILLGKIEGGKIRKGDSVLMMPNKTNVEILQITSDENDTTEAKAGENVKLKVRGIEEEDVSPGFVLCDTSSPCHTCKVFDAQILIAEHKSIICAGYSAVLHIHTAVEEVQITTLIALVDKKSGERTKMRPRFIKQDQVAIARFECAGVLCMETFNDFQQMGRFTLRDEGKTIGFGKVLKLR